MTELTEDDFILMNSLDEELNVNFRHYFLEIKIHGTIEDCNKLKQEILQAFEFYKQRFEIDALSEKFTDLSLEHDKLKAENEALKEGENFYKKEMELAQKENEELKHHIKSHHLDMQKNQQENNQLKEIKKRIKELKTTLENTLNFSSMNNVTVDPNCVIPIKSILNELESILKGDER